MSNKAFNCDGHIGAEFLKLIQQFGIRTIIETGTYYGDTTGELLKMVPTVHSIEINSVYYAAARASLGSPAGLKLHLGNSPEVLIRIIPDCDDNILFFLDAHWYDHNPLLNELSVIARYEKKNAVIVIHDFKVPDHPEFGFDKFPDGAEYSIDMIRDHLNQIYGRNYEFYYNTQAEGSRRGVIYIIPKGIKNV